MSNPLDNRLDSLQDGAGDAPPWVWKGAGLAAGIAGATLARKLLNGIRGKVSARGGAPLNPGDERMSWPNALVWAAVVGVGAALGRLLAQRVVAAAWTKRSRLPVRMMPAPRG